MPRFTTPAALAALCVAFLYGPAAVHAAALLKFSLTPASVPGGTNSTGKVTLDAPAPSGGYKVSLKSGNTAAATVPASVTVAAGATTASFTVTTYTAAADTSARLKAADPTVNKFATLTVTKTPASLIKFSLSPTSVPGGTNSTGKVTLSGAAPTGGYKVTLKSGTTTAATVPASVTVASGQTTATFTVTTFTASADTTVQFKAADPTINKFATLTITKTPTPITLQSLSISPSSVTGGASATLTVTLSGAAPAGGATVALSSSSTAATVPASVTVAAGATSATATVATSSVSAATTATLRASYGGSLSTTLTINPAAIVTPASVSLNPSTIQGGDFSIATVTLSAPAPAGGLTLALRSNNPSEAYVPDTLFIPAGATSGQFEVDTLDEYDGDTFAYIFAAANGVSVYDRLTILETD